MVSKYERGYSFSGWQATNPNRPLPGPALDNELDNLETSVSGVVDGLNDIRRSDGGLKNGIVTKEALAPGLSTGVEPATTWEINSVYSVNAVVFYEAAFYRCLQSHTASADFAADLAAGYWLVFADFGDYFDDTLAARDEAVAAASTASSAATTASGAATTASGAATTASGAATTATNAANSATAAFDSFDDRYLGEKTSFPTVDNDGNALVNGALVFVTSQPDSANDGMYVRLNGAWQKVVPASDVLKTQAVYSSALGNLAGGQTTFTVTGGYVAGYAGVYLNGVKLVNGTNVTVTSGTNFVLSTGVSASDVIEFEGYRLLNTVQVSTQAEAEAGSINTTFMTPLRTTQNFNANVLTAGLAQKPRRTASVALTNPAAFGTWVLASGVRHGFFGQHYDGSSYDQNGTVRVINDDGTVGATVQTIATRGLYCVTPFTIAGVRYVLLVNYAKTTGGFSYNTNSEIYRYNTVSGQYDLFQSFGLDGAVRGQFYSDGTDHWLTIASSVTTGNNYSRFLYIYKWNGTSFALENAPSTQGCYSGAVFKVSTTRYAVTCEYTDGNSGGQVRDSRFLQWNGTNYIAWNAFQGKGCSDVAVFTLNGYVYAAFANQFDSLSNDIGSPIYRVTNTGITPVDYVKSSFGIRVRAFTVNGRVVLAYCNVARGSSLRTDYDEGRVDLYIFDGAAAKLWMSIPAYGPYDAEIWTTAAGRVFIGIANSVSGTDSSFNTAQAVTIHELPNEPVATDISANGHETPSAFGQCRLVRVNTTTVRLDRHNGRLLTADGRVTEIPHGGILRDNAGLAANTTYRVFYAAHDGPPRLLINSTRTGFLDRSTGMYVKDDDFRWTLVGRVVTDNNAQFPADANVISWFNTTLPFTP